MFSNRPARTRNTTQSEPRVRVVEQRDSGTNSSNNEAYHLRDRVQRKLLSEADGEVNLSHLPQMRQMIETLFFDGSHEEFRVGVQIGTAWG